ncbi:hypothetical protein NYO99_10465 [Pelomonas sp. UHG3]|uniref:Uncharacterized protein n=1 Tax=Roseateles hydrophilus TaxID=2975054 RepID=A0ACC6CAE3_9BURK|nr:hypothetical protein [Pelomonas sp. UHG3]MCY4745393.1 hypothetical protein [Pelomonas sp. UHG3]
MKTWSTLRPLTLSAALLATLTLTTAPASAQEPTVPAVSERLMLRQAQGEYLLEDGRTLKVHVGMRRVGVALDESPLEDWKAAGHELLVSPDGLRRVRFMRNADGSVSSIAFETDRVVR